MVSGDPEVLTGPLSHGQSLRYSYQDGSSMQFARRLGVDNTNLLRLAALYRNNPDTILTAAVWAPSWVSPSAAPGAFCSGCLSWGLSESCRSPALQAGAGRCIAMFL